MGRSRMGDATMKLGIVKFREQWWPKPLYGEKRFDIEDRAEKICRAHLGITSDILTWHEPAWGMFAQ